MEKRPHLSLSLLTRAPRTAFLHLIQKIVLVARFTEEKGYLFSEPHGHSSHGTGRQNQRPLRIGKTSFRSREKRVILFVGQQREAQVTHALEGKPFLRSSRHAEKFLFPSVVTQATLKEQNTFVLHVLALDEEIGKAFMRKIRLLLREDRLKIQ